MKFMVKVWLAILLAPLVILGLVWAAFITITQFWGIVGVIAFVIAFVAFNVWIADVINRRKKDKGGRHVDVA